MNGPAIYTKGELELFCARAAQAAIEAALQAIEDEPELPGDMPDAMWESLRKADREEMVTAFRVTVQKTKEGIRERLLSSCNAAPHEGEKP
jgi:catalase